MLKHLKNDINFLYIQNIKLNLVLINYIFFIKNN